MGSWAHSWCPRFVHSVRLLYSPKAFHLLLVLVPQRPFPVVGAKFTPTLPADHVLHHTLSVYGRFIQCTAACSLPGRCGTALQRPLSVRGVMLSTSVLVVQRYFLAMGVGPAPTLPMARTLRRALERHIQCTAAYPPPGRSKTALQRPLQVPWGRILCLAPCSPVLLPYCGCWACIDHASGSCSLSRPQHTWALLSDALQRVLRQVGGRPPFHVLYKSSGALLRASFLIPQRYFLDVDAGPVSASPVARSPHCALIAHRRTARTTPPVDCALRRAPGHTGALSDALQRVLCPSGGRPPFNNLYKSPGGALRTLILVPQRYFLVVGAGQAPTPPADRALRRAFSARSTLSNVL
ncbi:hypothetical protein NDU88_007035 [Pleurodeles waltl]|uniref:Uncharacterized protein n=1 Tax=Pleurodeles waltl TaxID=8319 RepID=A0AAV7PSZ2_PLEWA|nr:hypothetical protein NDU88_007035 [Pleurodeles waltl]